MGILPTSGAIMSSRSSFHRVDVSRFQHYHQDGGDAGYIESEDKIGNIPSWTDYVNLGGPIPEWRSVIASGGNATTSLSGRLWVVSFEKGRCSWTKTHPAVPAFFETFELHGGLTPVSMPGPSTDSIASSVSADNLALTRYYSHLNSLTTKFSGLVFSGELKESLNMIRHPAKALRGALNHYLGGLRRRGPRLAKRSRPSFVRESWLEFSFGVKPLIRDLDDAIKAFYGSRSIVPIFEMVKGRGENRNVVETGQMLSYGPLQLSYLMRQTERFDVKYFGIQHSSGNGVSDSHKYGFKPEEFVPTVWELIPYSFLVDYFSNVGDVLSSWSYRTIRNGWTAKTSRRTLTFESTNEVCQKVHLLNVDGGYTVDQGGTPGRQVRTFTQVDRLPELDPGLPSLELQVPGQWTQWMNIAALSKNLDRTRRSLR